MKILLVEDEIKALEGIAGLIGELPPDYIVTGQARNAATGIELACALRPDLIITDIQMNGMNGLEMIRHLSDRGLKCRYIVLSGFADFKYAQEGISLGITDYLLKPVTREQLEKAVNKVRSEIEQESGRIQIGQLSEGELLEGAIFAETSVRGVYLDEWKRRTGQNLNGYLLLVRGDNRIVQADWDRINEIIDGVMSDQLHCSCRHTSSKECYIYYAAFCEDSLKRLDRALRICKESVNGFLIFAGTGMSPEMSPEQCREQLMDLSEWNLTLGNGRILTQERIAAIQTKKFTYPDELEQKLMSLIGNGTADQMKVVLKQFMEYLREGVYAYTDVREALISMTASILYAVRRSSYGLYENISSLNVLDWVKEVLFPETYYRMILNILVKYEQCRINQRYASHPIVNRALKLLTLEYRQNLSLEEMAQRLDVTPEYLSALFMKELGVKYTTYRAQVRIDRAKALLEEGKLKIYEVADESGFPDVKYFSKVFKKYTGVSPGEYVRTQRG